MRLPVGAAGRVPGGGGQAGHRQERGQALPHWQREYRLLNILGPKKIVFNSLTFRGLIKQTCLMSGGLYFEDL